MRSRRPVAMGMTVVAVSATVAGGAVANAAPAATITAPTASGALFGTGPVTFRGEAADAASVQVAVQDRTSRLWWRSDGTWGDQERFTAAQSGSTWSYTWIPSEAGEYLVQVLARDTAGRTDPTPPYASFTVLNLTPGDRPDSAVATPGSTSVVRAGTPMTARGLATDDIGVASVGVAVQNRTTRQWWRSDGTWGAFQRHPATLTGAEGRTVTWTFGWTPPADGDYALQVTATDTAGGADAEPAYRPFAADGAAPDATISGVQDSSHPAGRAITWTGTATDGRGVAEVHVAVQNRTTRQWWRSDGTWGAFQRVPATLTGPPNGTSSWTMNDGRWTYTQTGWTFTWVPPGAGDYGLQVTAADATGQADPVLPWLRFSATPAPADTTRPSAEFTAPLADRALTAGPVRISGSSADDTAVTAVHLGILDRDTGQWWQPGGGWGPYRRLAPVTTGLGTRSATWSYDWTPPQPGGRYLAHVEAFDTAGNVAGESGRPSVRFDVRPGATGFVSLLMSRSQWQVVDERCAPRRGAVPLDQVAAELGRRGVRATGTVVVNRTSETTRECLANFTGYANWSDLKTLQERYGWTFVSHGATYANMTQLSSEQQRAESCGSLTTLAAHGHDRAWGLFAYPNNQYSDQIQRDVVATCFAYGRRYGPGRNTTATTGPPYFQNTWSWPSVRCNDPALTCYHWTPGNETGRYTSPERLGAALSGGAGEWQVIQGYKFLRGRRVAAANQGQQWDCTSTDWRAHWTNSAESYCLVDLLTAVSTARGATFTDPATVAETWNRQPHS